MTAKLTDAAWRLIVSARGSVASAGKTFRMSRLTFCMLCAQRRSGARTLYGVSIRDDERLPYGEIELRRG